jgi:hypothetical protein
MTYGNRSIECSGYCGEWESFGSLSVSLASGAFAKIIATARSLLHRLRGGVDTFVSVPESLVALAETLVCRTFGDRP